MRREPLVRWAGLLLGFLLQAQPGHASDTIERVVPSEFCGNYVFLELVFDESPEKSLRLVFDTGASQSLIDPDSIERISGERVKLGKRARFSNLRAGPLIFNSLRARVRELDHIADAFGEERFDGILGFGALKQVLVTIDYPNRELRIAEGALAKPDDVEIFRYRGKSRPFLRTRVDGRRVDLLIDSGSNDPIAIHEKHDLDWVGEPVHLASAVRIDRIEQRFVGRLSSDVVFGPITFQQPIVEQTNRTELVGTEILKHFEITFDQRNRRVRMIPATDRTRIRLDGRRSTGVVSGLHPRGREVTRVVEDSPARELGIEVGDVVTSINGISVLRGGCELRNMMDLEPEALNYVFERDGDRHEVIVPVVEFIP